MLNNNVDGIILEPTKSALPSPNTDLYQDLLKRNFPMVSIHATYSDVDIPSVTLDDNEAGFLAASHLLALRHTQIGAILKSDDLQGHQRYRGILRAHSQNKIPFDDKNVFWYTTEDISRFDNLEPTILERLKNCSAIVCYNDQVAFAYEKMLLNSGLNIPQDQAIASIDDSKYAPMAPVPLTSVHSPIGEIGKTAAELLLRLINGEKIEHPHVFRPTLVRRQSSGTTYHPLAKDASIKP